MIRLSPCNCCDGYVLTCDRCSMTSSWCSIASIDEAVEWGLSKGWKRVPGPEAIDPMEWNCPVCVRNSGK